MPDYRKCNQRIGDNLRHARIRQYRRQESLAAILQISRSTLSRIETGQRSLCLSEAIVLAERANISLDVLVNGTPIGF